jgi:dethiobiotin synthetase
VGKTTVLAAAARALRRQGRPVQVCKPVATGSDDDTRLLAAAAGLTDLLAITPWVLREPAAPPVAARCEGIELKLDDIVAAVRRLERPDVPLLVEGVGGLLCPLTERESVADLAGRLGLPLIVVARRSLGTLNHTLLTLEAALRRRLPVAGVVVSETEPVESLAAERNVEELRRRLDVPILGVLSHGQDDLADIDWWRLCGGA